MSVCVQLYLDPKWELDDIKTIIEKHLKMRVEIRSADRTSIGYFIFRLKLNNKEDIPINVFSKTKTPIGTATYLSMNSNEYNIEILRGIANVLGGFLCEKDYESKFEEIIGILDDSSGLPYFIKYALLNNEIKDEKDLVGLNESIHKWHDRVKASKEGMRLFPKEAN